MDKKVFYTDDGKMYAADNPTSPSHAQMNFPNEDILKSLTEVPCSREEMIGRINHVDFNRKEAVLAVAGSISDSSNVIALPTGGITGSKV